MIMQHILYVNMKEKCLYVNIYELFLDNFEIVFSVCVCLVQPIESSSICSLPT